MKPTVSKEFDPEAFVEGVPKPSNCSVPEWAEANFLMNLCRAMNEADLSEDQRLAVLTYLKLTPSDIARTVRDGFAAVHQAHLDVYQDTFEDHRTAADASLDEEF